MFSRLREYLSYANVVATCALVFAMSGGAIAAKHYLLSSTRQISPEVLKALRGKPGVPGPAGVTGSPGAQGPAGSQGAKGEAGPAGTPGAQGPQGEPGSAGKAGSPWTAGGTLPSGKSETGAWAANGGVEDAQSGIGFTIASFTLPLAAPPALTVIGFEEGEGEAKENARVKKENEKRKENGEPEVPLPIPSECQGSVSKPQAIAGDLCVFVGEVTNVNVSDIARPQILKVLGTTGFTTVLQPIEFTEGFSISGSWAVTEK
jgi:hypothetical protein